MYCSRCRSQAWLKKVGSAAADTDGNGLLSRAEVEAGLPRLAARFEATGLESRRPALAADELRASVAKSQSEDRRSSREGGFAEHFGVLTADRDGSLTRDEVEKGLPRIAAKFDRIDTDRNARLTQEELRRYFDAKRAARSKPLG